MFESTLSLWVLLAFLATAPALLGAAAVVVRQNGDSAWPVAGLLVIVPLALLAVLSSLSWTIERTPSLVQAGFVLWVFAFAWLRRPGGALARCGPPLTPAALVALALVPLIGCVLSLPALWSGSGPSLLIPSTGQAAALAIGWVVVRRRGAPGRRDDESGAEHAAAPAQPSSPSSVARRVFISYRRDDSADVTGRIYDRLVARMGRDRVFKDVDSIPLGVDFRASLHEAVGACDVLVAVIGPRWLASTAEGTRRLDDARDFVRIEIEAALQRTIPVVPVLVSGAHMPGERDLPSSLAPLSYRNAVMVRPDPDFHRDMDRLIAGIERHGRLTA